MSRTPAGTGARTGDARPGDSPDNAAITEGTAAATPPAAGDPIIPEPFNPNFPGTDQSVAPGTPGLGASEDEPKIKVETTGEFMLIDPYTGDTVPADGSAEVRATTFISEKILAGQLKEV